MAIDPQELATEQTQRAALDQKGAPTEFASDPADAVQLAGGGTKALREVLNRAARPARVEETDGATTTANVVPDAQTQSILNQDGKLSYRKTQQAVAPRVLSPDGLQRFEAQNFQARPDEDAQVLQSAQTAIQDDAQEQFTDVQKLARQAVLQQKKGNIEPKADSKTIVSEDVADKIIAASTAEDLIIKDIKDGGDFNFNNINSTDDVFAAMTALGEIYKDPQRAAKRGVVPQGMTIKEAGALLIDEIGLTQKILNRKTGEVFNSAMLAAGRELLVKIARQNQLLAIKIKQGQGTDTDRLKLRRGFAIQSGIQLQIKGAGAEAARALNSFNIKVGGEDSAIRQAQEAQRLISASGGSNHVDDMAKSYLDAIEKKGLAGANEFARGSFRATVRQMTSEALLSGYLSNPASQFRNVFGGGLFMTFQLPAEMIAGMYGAAVRGTKKQLGDAYPIHPDQVYVNDAILRLKGWSDSFNDALRVGALAFKTERPAGSSKLDLETYSAITGKSNSTFFRALDELGKRIRIPLRLLLSADEFMKTISARGELYVQANGVFQASLRAGKTLEDAQDDAAMAILDPRAFAKELDLKAKYDTLQSDLGIFGELANKFQRIDLAGIPVGRSILPFMTAPTNSAIHSAEMVPFLNLLTPHGSKALTELKPNTRAHQLAVGRMALGGATMYSIGMLTLQGRVTGSMPADPKVREKLPDNWQPYSFVFKGKGFPEGLPLFDEYGRPNGPLRYVSYAGYEPVGAVFGITADTVQRTMMTRDPAVREDIALAAVLATREYFLQLPMLQGIADVNDAFFSDQSGIDVIKVFKGLAESATDIGLPSPVSALQRAAGRAVEPGKTVRSEFLTYYTVEDVLQKNEDGTFKYALGNGKPNYRLVGLPKRASFDEYAIVKFFKELDAMQSRYSITERGQLKDFDQMFHDTSGKYVPRYNTYGEQMGAAEVSLAVNPLRAIFNNFSGMKISDSERPPAYKLELMRLADMTNEWPLTNPKAKGGLQLGATAQSDLVNYAKNETDLRIAINPRKGSFGKGGRLMGFREHLEDLLTGTSTKARYYQRATDKEKLGLIRDLNNLFLDAGFERLMDDPKHAAIRKAFLELQDPRVEAAK